MLFKKGGGGQMWLAWREFSGVGQLRESAL